MICPNCGNMNEDGAKFCTSCGTVLETPVVETPVVEMPTYEPPVQPLQGTPVATEPTGTPAKGLGLAAMICGICSLVFCCIGFLPGPAAIILSAIAKSKGNKSGMTTAGLITGIIGTIIGIIYLFIMCAAMMESSYYYY